MATYYTDDHEWIDVDGDTATIGITAHAAEQLGEVVFIELKDSGDEFDKGDEMGVVESVKAASDIYAPLACEVLEGNDEIVDTPRWSMTAPKATAGSTRSGSRTRASLRT